MTTTIQFNKTQWANLIKFTNKKDVRVNGVYHSNNYLVATDSYKAVFIFDDFSDKNGKVLDKDQNEINSNFPANAIDRMIGINFEDTNDQFKADIAELLQIHKEILPEAKKDSKGNNTMYMEIKGDDVVFADRENNSKHEYIGTFRTWKHDDSKVFYNCKYMIDILTLFKSFKHKEIIIKYKGAMRPINIESLDGKIKVILLPVRTY